MYTCVYAYIPPQKKSESLLENYREYENFRALIIEKVFECLLEILEKVSRELFESLSSEKWFIVFMEIAERYTVYFEKRFQ